MFAAVVMGVLAGVADTDALPGQWVVVYEGEGSKTVLDVDSIKISGDFRKASDATFQPDGSVFLAHHEYNCLLGVIRTDRLFLHPSEGDPKEARVAEKSQQWRPVTENGITSLLLRIVCEK
jgi:hypothetical protein